MEILWQNSYTKKQMNLTSKDVLISWKKEKLEEMKKKVFTVKLRKNSLSVCVIILPYFL